MKQGMNAVAETWRRVWGYGQISRGPRFLNHSFFGKKVHFHGQNFDDLFLVIDQVFRIFHFFTMLNVVYDPFLTRKTTEKPLFQKRIPLRHLFLLCSYFRPNLTTLLLKILGWGSSPSPT